MYRIPIAPGCGDSFFVSFVSETVRNAFRNTDLDVLYPHFPRTVRLCVQSIELLEGQVFKVFREKFPGKVAVYHHLPVADEAAPELLLCILYSFFTVVISASPSMLRSLPARLIAIAGYSSRSSLSCSFCSSTMLSKAKVLDALLAELEISFT